MELPLNVYTYRGDTSWCLKLVSKERRKTELLRPYRFTVIVCRKYGVVIISFYLTKSGRIDRGKIISIY